MEVTIKCEAVNLKGLSGFNTMTISVLKPSLADALTDLADAITYEGLSDLSNVTEQMLL